VTDKPTILYGLGVIVLDDLSLSVDDIAEGLERSPDDVAAAIADSKPAYDRGEITQVEHWGRAALKLALEDVDVLQAFAINAATVDQQVLGKIRVQSASHVLGLVSDATPDFVGQFRKRYQLDELLHVHVIGSELDEERDYAGLLRLSAERLQATPGDITFVDRKPAHVEAARTLGFRVPG
jgi:beta-phosphoglucomutase-like phosphatase (HAD superfamily)